MTKEDLPGVSENFLDAMVSGAHDVQADMSDKFEQQCVHHVLTQLGLASHAKVFKAQRKQHTGVDGLDFLWFSGEFPDCPIQFCTARISHQLARRNWPRDWFLSFDKLPVTKAYDEYTQAMRDNGVDGAIGLIFLWPGWQTKLLLHNWYHKRTAGQGYWGYAQKSKDPVWLEPLDQVLGEVRRHWTPEVL